MVKIKSYKDNISDDILYYNNPKYVYIPLINQNDENITVMVKIGDKVKIGTVLGKRKGTFRIPILSSCSGRVVDITNKYYLNGKKVKCITILNDNLEEKEDFKVKKNLSKELFLKSLRDAGIVGLGGAGFPTYIKYSEENINTLIVNMVECEPYVSADYALFSKYIEDVLEGIDLILDINNISCAYIAIKKSDIALIEMLNDYLGSYLRIKLFLVKDYYPVGWEKILVKSILNKDYKIMPSEVGALVSNVSTIYAIYECITQGKILSERVVTFNGDGLKNPTNVKLKIGTLVSDVINYLGGYNDEEYFLIAGGPMMGKSIPSDDLVISLNLNAITVIKGKEKKIPEDCLRCGKCMEVCPALLAPSMIKDSLNDVVKLKKLHPEKCMACNLCSFICPANINISQYVQEAKNKLGGNDND